MISGGNSHKVIVVRCSNHPRKLADSLRTFPATGFQEEFNLYPNPKAPSGIQRGRILYGLACCFELLALRKWAVRKEFPYRKRASRKVLAEEAVAEELAFVPL